MWYIAFCSDSSSSSAYKHGISRKNTAPFFIPKNILNLWKETSIKGKKEDGHLYVKEAIKKGAIKSIISKKINKIPDVIDKRLVFLTKTK